MTRILTLFLFFSSYSGAQAQQQDCSVLLNHFLIVVDSNTYQSILGSELLNSDFAFAKEMSKNWEGIYIIGQDNYIEIFHPKSIADENLPIGFSWICQTSLVANCTEKYDLPNIKQITYSSDEIFDELSVQTQDSTYYAQDSSVLITTREMNRNQYESWTKKVFNDSLNFLTTDYNSAAESDSSKNYLFNNVSGITVSLNRRDSISVTQYLNLIGYSAVSNIESKSKFSNSIDFIELDFSKNVEFASISTIYFELDRQSKSRKIAIGNTEIIIEGNTGIWELNNLGLTKAN